MLMRMTYGRRNGSEISQMYNDAGIRRARVEVNSWYGVIAPAATPAPLLDKINADVTTVVAYA
jgi:hypothetical protein